MTHRRWTLFGYGADSIESATREHNALYDAWKVERSRATDMLDENNRLDRDLDEARKRIVELESPPVINKVTGLPTGEHATPRMLSDETIDIMAREASYSIGGWGYDNWDKGIMRDAWRNSVRRSLAAIDVVPIEKQEAPTRVPFSDAQIERMAKALREAVVHEDGEGHFNLCFLGNWKKAIRAALAAGGLEPCAVPEYDPADVALASSDDEVEKLARVLRETHAKTCGKVPDAYELDGFRNDARAAIAHLRQPTGHVLRDRLVDAERKVENQRMSLRELHEARERDALKLAAVTAERDRFQGCYEQEIGEDEVAARKILRKRLNVPASEWPTKYIADALDELDDLRSQLAALRERDAVPVSAGVPSVEELVEIALGTSEPHGVSHRQVAAIRDRILAGLAQPSSKSGQFDADEVEALARVLCAAYCAVNKYGKEWESQSSAGRDHYMAEARAAIAHIRKRPEGLPTALMLAQSAFAAIRPTDSDGPYQPKPETDRWVAIADHILAALAPYLRDPVGWELDVTWQEMSSVWSKHGSIKTGMEAVLDLCRSRMRSTYKCRECAAWKAKYNESNQEINKALEAFGTAMPALNAARAALEGE